MHDHSYDPAIYRSLLDAVPLPVFVVDHDVRIVDVNRMAAATFGLETPAVFRQRGGAALRCMHATDSPGGCGRGPACRACVIRNAVGESMRGRPVVRRRTRAELRLPLSTRQLDLLVSASPLPGQQEKLSILILEDISDAVKLRELIPICANCRRVRHDDEYWVTVESYFANRTGVDFSHSVCPDCRKAVYSAMDPARVVDPEEVEASAIE